MGQRSALARIFDVSIVYRALEEIMRDGVFSPRSSRRQMVMLSTLLACAIALMGSVTPAFAGSPPKIKELLIAEVNGSPTRFATRMPIVAAVDIVEPDEAYEGKVLIEYTTSVEAGRGGPWIVALSEPASEKGGFAGKFLTETLIRHLTPETEYSVRLVAENRFGSATKTIEFTTTAVEAPEVILPSCGTEHSIGPNPVLACGVVSTTSANLRPHIETDGAATEYHLEYSSESTGSWIPCSTDATGSISVAEEWAEPKCQITGLDPEKQYYFRVAAKNSKGSISHVIPFETLTVHPRASTPTIDGITGTTAHFEGEVDPGTYESSWRFEYATDKNGPWTLVPGGDGTISQSEAEAVPIGGPDPKTEAELMGLSPSKTYYVRLFAENSKGTFTSPPTEFETNGPPAVDTLATHAIDGESIRVLGTVTPNGTDTHYHFQYVSQQQFEAQGGEGGFAKAESTPEVDAGSGERAESGYPTTFVGQDLPGLEPGETYDFRIVASSSLPGNPVVYGEAQTLTAPAAAGPAGEAQSSCPNQQYRTGLSTQLPDCRAFEQITPLDKEGAFEPFNAIGGGVSSSEARFSEDGDDFMVEGSNTNWGSGQSPYFFSRTPTGWQMTSAAPQPQTGVDKYTPRLTSPDLTDVSLSSEWKTTGGTESPDIEFKVGPPGGPYTTVASIPRAQAQGAVGGTAVWVAASEDFSKLILEVEDHSLVGQTGTKSGSDLYEYSEGQLRQVNVSDGGKTIGSCGATIVSGGAEGNNHSNQKSGSQAGYRAVSADGARVFFEAVPSSDCSAAKHLYMRMDGSETVDIGEYTFLAATADGSMLLLEKSSGEAHELFLYNTVSNITELLFSVRSWEERPTISEDFNVIYFASGEALPNSGAPQGGGVYRFDMTTRTLRFMFAGNTGYETGKQSSFTHTVSPDGRYYYFDAREVFAVPGGGEDLRLATTVYKGRASEQLYRYDSVENVVECVSCASPFDPGPKLGVENDGGEEGGGSPSVLPVISANGDYAFFDTPAALVPQDLDGEIPPSTSTTEAVIVGPSPSWDIYEWRKDGVDGCAQVQGCVSLITPGTDGVSVSLIGTTPSGSDVFFNTYSSLLPQDKDTAGDVYDARIDGGFPVAASPLECEGDACSTPAGSPIDATPSSLTFTGTGNVIPPAPVVSAKAKAKKKTSKCAKAKRCVKKRKRRKTKAKSHKGGKR
jgi:hypothetical protein